MKYTEIENDDGRKVKGVVVSCEECGAKVESYGQEDKSVRRCLAMMRDECECDDGADAYFMCDDIE